MEGEGEADRKEESAEPRGGGAAKAVDDEAETGAGSRRRAVGEMDSLERAKHWTALHVAQTIWHFIYGRVGSQISTWERDHPGASRERFMAVITHRTRLRGGGGRSQTWVRRRDHPRANWEGFMAVISR